MIKKLRKRFIMVTAMALLGMIVVLMTAINVIYIYRNEKSLNRVLNIIIENQGKLPTMDINRMPKKAINDEFAKSSFFKRKYGGNREMIFTTRFCVVNLDSNKEIVNIYSDKI